MIKLEYISDVNAITSKENEKSILFKITGLKNSQQNKKRLPLNISLVIDTSTSMNDYVNSPDKHFTNNFPNHNLRHIFSNAPIGQVHAGIANGYEPPFPQAPLQTRQSKLSVVKKAAQRAILMLNDDDMVSLVTFSDKAELIQTSIPMTMANKSIMHLAIERIRTSGSTNLHEGWFVGATEVAKKHTNNKINRVLLLTDGQTNRGIVDAKTICTDISSLFEKGISVSTFGVGSDFNEDLLQKIANVGGGNSYYIDDENKTTEIFESEINGLSNIAADQVKLKFELNSGVEVKECLNNFEMKNSNYLLTNITAGQTLNAFFKFKIKPSKKSKTFDFGKVTVDFKDENGNDNTITLSPSFPVVSEKEFKDMVVNEEIKAQEVILVIANNKLNATKHLDMGDKEGATKILRESVLYAQAQGNDARILNEITSLTGTIAASSDLSSKAFRKDLSYQSYSTRNNK